MELTYFTPNSPSKKVRNETVASKKTLELCKDVLECESPGPNFLLLTWFSHWLKRLIRLFEVNLKLHLQATPFVPQLPGLLYFSGGVNVVCYCTSECPGLSTVVCQTSSVDHVKLCPTVMKQQFGSGKWKLDLFINPTSISLLVSGLLQTFGICRIYRVLFICGSLLSAITIMQILQT